MAEVAVVGKGLFGAAVGRHLAAIGVETTLIGPDEPSRPATHRGPFGAHFDEARILVARGDDAERGLTEISIAGMLDLERAAGVKLIERSGALEVGPGSSRAGRVIVDAVVSVPADSALVEAPAPQGHFNPRRYIGLAVADAVAGGATVVRSAATNIVARGDGYLVTTALGVVPADRVVMAAGAWSNRLLTRPVALRLKREYVLFAELDAATASSIRIRPTVLHGRTGNVESIYTLPPLRYPDRRTYLKLGANTLFDRMVGEEGVDDWYREGDSEVARGDLTAAFATVFPDTPVVGFHTERCVITYTPHGRPFIDQIGSGMFAAIGGNGHGASWADGVGRLAASLVVERGWGEMPRDPFRAIFADEASRWTRPLLADQSG